MYHNPRKYAAMPLGIVIRRRPGATRWAKWSWKVVAVLPGAPPADWKLLRRDGDRAEFHAATVTLELHGAEAEAYMHGLSAEVPGICVVMRPAADPERPFEILLATASPYEAQDYEDSGEDVIENVPMPDGLVAWVRDFAQAFHEDEPFRKRKRDEARVDVSEDGKGDARIRQVSDVFRSPVHARKERLQ